MGPLPFTNNPQSAMNYHNTTQDTRKEVQGLMHYAVLLHALQEENAAMKTQLAEAILNCGDCDALDTLEDFQGRFLAKDTVIALLRRDLAALSGSMERIHIDTTQHQNNFQKIGNDLQRMQEQVHRLKSEFQTFLRSMPSIDEVVLGTPSSL